MKTGILLLLSATIVFGGSQPSQVLAAPQLRTCNGFDGPFQLPASQKCPASGYAHSDQPTSVDIKGRPKAAARAKATRASSLRTCNGFDGPFQVPASQKCPASGYAHSDQPTGVDIKGRSRAKATAPRTSKYRNCSGIDGAFQVPVSQKCPLSGYAHY